MFQRALRQTTRQMGQNTVAILMALALQYLLMTLKVVALEKSLLVIHKILRLFVSTLPVKDKHYLLKRENLPQPIQMQLCQKQKNFYEFYFLHF